MSIQGLLFALLLTLFVLVWIVMPLLQRAPKTKADPLTEAQQTAQNQTQRLLLHYERILRNIRDLDEDHALGKIDEDEYTRDREEWAQRGVQVLQALDTIAEREEQSAPKPTVGTTDRAVDDAIEAAIQRYRQRKA